MFPEASYQPTVIPTGGPASDVVIDSPLGPDRIFIERAGLLQQVQDVFLGEKSLMVAVKNIARRLGDDISESKPILDSRLPDGSRVAAVIPPCSLSGVTL